MKKYLNLRTVYGVETVDELNTEDFKTLSDFNRELKRLKSEYRLNNMNVYSSQRATKEWNN